MPLVFSYAQPPPGCSFGVHLRKRPRGEEAVNKNDGIYIIENLNLAELSAARVFEFFFVCLPLRDGQPRPASGPRSRVTRSPLEAATPRPHAKWPGGGHLRAAVPSLTSVDLIESSAHPSLCAHPRVDAALEFEVLSGREYRTAGGWAVNGRESRYKDVGRTRWLRR